MKGRAGRYLVWGYYGHGNLGDELILKVIAGKIAGADPDAKIYVRCYNRPQVNGVIPFRIERPVINLPFIKHLVYAARLLLMIAKIDILVIGGGTLFLDKGRFNQSIYFLNIAAYFAKVLNKKIFIIGAGIDVLEHPKNIVNLRSILDKSDRIYLRDSFSYNTARSLINGDKVYKSADLLFDADYAESLRAGAPVKNNRIVVSLSDYFRTWGNDSDRRRLMESSRLLIKRLLYLYGEESQVFLAAFQKDIGEKDYEFLRDIMGSVIDSDGRYKKMIMLEYLNTEARVREIFASASFVIGMRYHALVLGAIFKKPFFGINIETKIREICVDFGMPFVDISDFLDEGIDESDLAGLCSRVIDENKVREQGLLSKVNFEWVGR